MPPTDPDNPYDAPPEESKSKKGRTTKARTKGLFTFEPDTTVEVPNIAQKIEIGTAGLGKVVSKVRPITGYVIIHESKDIGKNLDKALHELATKNPIVRKAVFLFATVGESVEFLEPLSYVFVAAYMEQAMRRNPDDPLIVKCFEYLKNNGIDLASKGLVELEAEADTSLNGAQERQRTALEEILEQQREQREQA